MDCRESSRCLNPVEEPGVQMEGQENGLCSRYTKAVIVLRFISPKSQGWLSDSSGRGSSMRLGGLRDKCAEHTDCRGMLPQKSFKIYVLSGGTSIWKTRKTTLHCFVNTKTITLQCARTPRPWDKLDTRPSIKYHHNGTSCDNTTCNIIPGTD